MTAALASRVVAQVFKTCLNLIVEVTGQARKDKVAKVTTARTLWVPAVNNHGGFGRWAFVEVTDPWDAQRTIRATVSGLVQEV